MRDASASQIMGNAEIQSIKQIMGLQHGKVHLSSRILHSFCRAARDRMSRWTHSLSCLQRYEDTKSLRYGHLMIMTDQDHDGSHIKGLIMNFMHHFYPSLLKVPDFLQEFVTPIVKVRF